MREITKINFADVAEELMEEYIKSNRKTITTSKIRNILEKINKLGESAKEKTGKLTDEELSEIQYIKMRIAYDAGRDRDVMNFVKITRLMQEINNIGNSREKLEIFYNYFEALVAYHRYFGGRDN